MAMKVPHISYDGNRADGKGKVEGVDGGEVIDLELFERAVDKLSTHNAYCMNCTSRITKFFLGRVKNQDSETSPVPGHHQEGSASASISQRLFKQTSNKTLLNGDKLSYKLLKQKSNKTMFGRRRLLASPESADIGMLIATADDTELVLPVEVGGWEIINSIMYGGLMVSITSLGVVSSAAASRTDTARIVIIGVANLLVGLFVICSNLLELKNNEQTYRYEKLLGKRENFLIHAVVALLSYLLFGLVPPVVYGFTFGESEHKLITVAVISFMCITILSTTKACTQGAVGGFCKQVKTVLYDVVGG